MNKRFDRFNYEVGQGLVEVALMLLLVSVVTSGVLVAVGPQVGGVFSDAHAAIAGVSNPSDATPVILNTATPTVTSTPSPATPTPTPTLPPLPTVGTPVVVPTVPTFPPTATPTPTPVPTATPAVECSSFSFSGRLLLTDGNSDGFSEGLVFGWAYLADSGSHGAKDKPAGRGGYMTWKFIALGPARLTGRYSESGDGFEFELDSAPVSLQIAPLGQKPELSGQVSFNQLWIGKKEAGLNREQAVNVSGIQVQSGSSSDTLLRAFAGQDQGVLEITFKSNESLAKKILKGQKVQTSFNATMRPAVCP
ncbi:MAG: hypothetical protein SVX38_00395 [Chloroflexota bacterium]|nr:hypothetical protein [Chloroflexota bacterium]